MSQKTTRKPFVAPQLREEASLAGVTLISGGGQQPPSLRSFGRSRRGNYHFSGLNRHGHSGRSS